MKPSLTRDEFLVVLGTEIVDDNRREQLLQAAKELIPGEASMDKLRALNSSQVYKGLKAYREHHPNCGWGKPDIPELVRWLMEEGAVKHARDLEERLQKIHEILMGAGDIRDETQLLSISAGDMLYIRYLSSLDLENKG